eukprot:6350770-Amphidinium_carterae.1
MVRSGEPPSRQAYGSIKAGTDGIRQRTVVAKRKNLAGIIQSTISWQNAVAALEKARRSGGIQVDLGCQAAIRVCGSAGRWVEVTSLLDALCRMPG